MLLINLDQTGFNKGKYIGQNVRLINDILEETKIQNIPWILLQLDLRKAFDTIELDFIQKTISLFNFGDDIIKHWISTFYAHSASAVLNKGFNAPTIFSFQEGHDRVAPCPHIYSSSLLSF